MVGNEIRVFWREYRCRRCGRLQFKAYLPMGARVQVKCWHGSCGAYNVYKITENGVEFTDEIEQHPGNIVDPGRERDRHHPAGGNVRPVDLDGAEYGRRDNPKADVPKINGNGNGAHGVQHGRDKASRSGVRRKAERAPAKVSL